MNTNDRIIHTTDHTIVLAVDDRTPRPAARATRMKSAAGLPAGTSN